MKLRRLMLALIPLLAGGVCSAKDSCFECHSVVEGTSVVFKDDVHYTNGVSCAACHGGDANEDDQNVSMHADRGFKLRVTREGMPDYCGRCHSDTNFMWKHKLEQRVDQLALYRSGVHGRQLAAGQTAAAECVDCHGVHDIRAVSDPLSTVHPQQVAATCAKCHAATADLFRKSPHGRVFTSRRRPGCTVCHAGHATEPATTAMLAGAKAVCARCHKSGSDGDKVATEMARLLTSLETAGPGSKEALARARLAVHTLDVAAVKQAAGPAGVEASNAKLPEK
jgi:predicted CXXCH cytochrome family protein